MQLDDPDWPLLDDSFASLAEGRSLETRRRYERVRHRLYDFLDVDDMTEWLPPADATLLAAEREFGRDGALRNALGVEGLLYCLPGFVAEARLPTTATEARMQISVANRLLAHLGPHDRVHDPTADPYRIARSAMVRARVELDDRLHGAPLPARNEIQHRLRQQPGPEW